MLNVTRMRDIKQSGLIDDLKFLTEFLTSLLQESNEQKEERENLALASSSEILSKKTDQILSISSNNVEKLSDSRDSLSSSNNEGNNRLNFKCRAIIRERYEKFVDKNTKLLEKENFDKFPAIRIIFPANQGEEDEEIGTMVDLLFPFSDGDLEDDPIPVSNNLKSSLNPLSSISQCIMPCW